MKTSAKKPTLVICSSLSFYRQAVELQEQLEKLGLTVVLPDSALKMKANNDYEPTHYKSWFENTEDYSKKQALMRLHFSKIAKGDAILVLNFEKNGHKNYIGANVIMEMGIALHLHKKIFIYNEMPDDSPFEEELKGMMPVVLHGKAEALLPELLK